MKLTDTEVALAAAAKTGVVLNRRSTVKHWLDDRSAHRGWTADRLVRGEFLTDLCIHGDVTRFGIRALGLKVVGPLDLSYADVQQRLLLNGCVFEEPIELEASRCRELEFSASLIPALHGDRLTTQGRLVLAGGCTVLSGVRLLHARIGEAIHAAGVFGPDDTGTAIEAGGVRATEICFDDVAGVQFCAIGTVDLIGAEVSGNVSLDGAILAGPSLMNDALAHMGYEPEPPERQRMLRALAQDGNRLALDLNRAIIGGSLHLREGFHAEGEVCALGLEVRGTLDAGGSFLTCARAPGTSGDDQLEDKSPRGLNLRDAKIGRDLRLDSAHLGGQLDVAGARVGGQLDLDGAQLDPSIKGVVLNARDLNVVGDFGVRLARAPAGTLDLRGASVGRYWDHPGTFPGALRLRGFTYRDLPTSLPLDERMAWLGLDQDVSDFSRYDQVASVYRGRGKTTSARRVLIAGEDARFSTGTRTQRAWGLLLSYAVGYGYRPGRALAWIALLTVAGALIFGAGYPDDLHPSGKPSEVPTFNATMYSLDTLLPIIDLGQQRSWTPYGLSQVWSWLAIVAGWILTTAVVGAVTNRVRRDP